MWKLDKPVKLESSFMDSENMTLWLAGDGPGWESSMITSGQWTFFEWSKRQNIKRYMFINISNNVNRLCVMKFLIGSVGHYCGL